MPSKGSRTFQPKVKFPATVYVYEMGEGGETYFCVANGLNEIPEEQDGKPIATYSLTRQSNFRLKRDLV